ncbi:MAG TPA: hypothetical protein VKZ18_04195 [Polyangia bacterium]|nr:hypothetical protein [Polyangia bacterium]
MQHRFSSGPLALAVALTALASCKSATDVAPSGAFVLKVSLAPGAQMPDELRASIYDDTGALWSGARFPASGPLAPESASELGTILIQPGSVSGDLRIDLRGLAGGALVDEATLKIPHASFSGGTFDLALSVPVPPDTDGDGVPDPIDDCPTIADPQQTGCPVDAGASDGTTGRHDAAVDRPSTHDAAVDTATKHDAAVDVPRGNKGNGAGCGGANECSSGFCKDGVCCNNACDQPCQSCSTGMCNSVKSGEDIPECAAPMTCNGKGKCVSAAGGSGG